MNEAEVYAMTRKHPEVMPIESEARGLYYMMDPEKKGLLIAGTLGMAGYNVDQLKRMCKELPDILRVHLEAAV